MSKPIDYVAEGEENEALRWRDAEIASLRAKLDKVCGTCGESRADWDARKHKLVEVIQVYDDHRRPNVPTGAKRVGKMTCLDPFHDALDDALAAAREGEKP